MGKVIVMAKRYIRDFLAMTIFHECEDDCAGIDYIGSQSDVLWAAPVGEVLKYIRVRDAANFTNYNRSGHEMISFDVMHSLGVFQRQQVDGTAMLPIVFDNPVTLQVHILDTDNVQGVQVNGAPVSYTVQIIDSAHFVLFDTPLDTAQRVTVTVTVHEPQVNPGAQTSAEGAVISLQIGANDPDLESLTYSASGLPGGLSIDGTTGLIAGTIDYWAAVGSPYTVIVTATDPGGLTGNATFTWNVANTNQTPVVTNPGAQTSAEGAVISLQIGANDPDA